MQAAPGSDPSSVRTALTRIWRPDLPLLGICLVVIGGSLVLKPFFTRTTDAADRGRP